MNSLTTLSSLNRQSSMYLPEDIIQTLLYFLPIKTLLTMGETCRQLQELAQNPSYWQAFWGRIREINNRAELENPKEFVTIKIKQFIAATKESSDPYYLMRMHRKLNSVGLSSLDKAFEYAQAIQIRDDERDTLPDSPFYALSFYDRCGELAEDYLRFDRNFSKADEIRQKIVNLYEQKRVNTAFYLTYFLENNLEKALQEMQQMNLSTEEGDARLLFAFIAKAKQLKAIDIGLKALKECAQFRDCPCCIKDFDDFLLANGKKEESQELHASYPAAFEQHSSEKDIDPETSLPLKAIKDMTYYLYSGQITTALQQFRNLHLSPELFSKFGERFLSGIQAQKDDSAFFRAIYQETPEDKANIALLEQELNTLQAQYANPQ